MRSNVGIPVLLVTLSIAVKRILMKHILWHGCLSAYEPMCIYGIYVAIKVIFIDSTYMTITFEVDIAVGCVLASMQMCWV